MRDAKFNGVIPEAERSEAVRNPDKRACVSGFRARGLSPAPRNDPRIHRRERDPLHAARKRLEAAENESFLAHLEKCSEIAVMLARKNDKRMREVIEWGERALIEGEWKRCKRRIVFAQFFATEALAHTRCRRKPCRRAKRCAYGGLSCLRGYTLFREEEARAQAAFDRFISIMTAPETESEQALGRKAAKSDSTGGRR